MSTSQLSAQQLTLDAAVNLALDMTARMFSLPKETVAKIVQVGLPMMARMAEHNPELLRQMYTASLAALPEPVQDFYARMAENPVVRQATVDDYRAMYGAMLDAVNRETARQTGTTDGQARDVLAIMMPAVNHALGQANRGGDKAAFASVLGSVAH